MRSVTAGGVMRALLGVLAALALTGVIALSAVEVVPRVAEIRGGSQGGSPPSSDELAELATRLIAPPFAFPDGATQTVSLHPGALPPNAALDLPLPGGARLVGSVVRQRSNANASFDVVLDVSGKADEVTAFYERELAKKGFAPPPAQLTPQAGGFTPSGGPAQSKFFCKGEAPYITITVFARANAPNDVRAHYEPAQSAGLQPIGTPCGQKAPPGGVPPSRLPTLRAPDGVLLQSVGASMSIGGPRQQSDAVATTSKGAAELESFFATQLAAAGWTRVAGATNAPLAFSTWKVPGDGDWQGLLMVVEMPAKDRRSLMLRAESATGF